MKPKRLLSLSTLWMALVYLFLYLPIVVLVVYSFNDSRMVTFVGRLDAALVL